MRVTTKIGRNPNVGRYNTNYNIYIGKYAVKLRKERKNLSHAGRKQNRPKSVKQTSGEILLFMMKNIRDYGKSQHKKR